MPLPLGPPSVVHVRRLLRHTWIPLLLAVGLVAGVLVGLPWYYKTYRGALPERGMTAPELAWAGAYAPWRTHVRDTIAHAHANRNSIDGELGRILDRIAGCGEELWLEVGAPPSERLDAVAGPAVAACRAADAAREAYRAADDTPSWRTSAMLAAAGDALRSAEFELRRLMLSQRPLEHRGGPDAATSRVEPLLGTAISGEQPTEVLCWSEEEWPEVQAELAAVGLEGDPRLARKVNAYRFRVHAAPEVCGPLVRYGHGDGSEASPAVAEGLLALLHAAQHAVAGVEDEAEARCAALRLLPRAATRLGAPPDVAETLADQVAGDSRCD